MKPYSSPLARFFRTGAVWRASGNDARASGYSHDTPASVRDGNGDSTAGQMGEGEAAREVMCFRADSC